MYLFTVSILVFYTGELVWKERAARVDEIYDALPPPIWVTALSKVLAMAAVLFAIQVMCLGRFERGFLIKRPWASHFFLIVHYKSP